jgi:hypothetical protein
MAERFAGFTKPLPVTFREKVVPKKPGHQVEVLQFVVSLKPYPSL